MSLKIMSIKFGCSLDLRAQFCSDDVYCETKNFWNTAGKENQKRDKEEKHASCNMVCGLISPLNDHRE